MPNLRSTLVNSDPALLPALAQTWGVTTTNLTTQEILEALHLAMQEAARAAKVWEKLTEEQRGVLQSLVAAKDFKLPRTMFEAMYGTFRKPSRALIEREQPHLKPSSKVEALFYRGLIAEAFEQAQSGLRPVIYVPDELVKTLPLHKTTYADLKLDAPVAAPRQPRTLSAVDEDELEDVQLADTSIVDDMTTLLAYLRVQGAQVTEDGFPPEEAELMLPFMLVQDIKRLAFMLGVGYSAELIAVQDGHATTGKTRPQAWLSAPRAQQMRQLAEAWRTSTAYQDLWHVPGLFPDPTGWTYNPVIGREAALNFIKQYTPQGEWWAIDEFIDLVKAVEPDFQRPGGDYDSWYIRNEDAEYLRGFESWDAVEGALLEFYCHAPLHWLGLLDLTEEAARLTVYGRAFLGMAEWHNPNIKPETIALQPDGTIHASRKVPTVDRFQLARFTSWQPFADDNQYTYMLDAAGLQRAATQGITPAQIMAFLKRQLDNKPVPPRLANLLETWQGVAATDVTLEHLLVLRTTSREVLDRLYDTPALRRYLRARLGEMACAVDASQVEALRGAMAQVGIHADILN